MQLLPGNHRIRSLHILEHGRVFIAQLFPGRPFQGFWIESITFPQKAVYVYEDRKGEKLDLSGTRRRWKLKSTNWLKLPLPQTKPNSLNELYKIRLLSSAFISHLYSLRAALRS